MDVAVDFTGLRATPDLVYLANEQGARAFTLYSDSSGIQRYFADVPDTPDQWIPTTAEQTCFTSEARKLRFCVETQPGQAKYVGRERYFQRRWSGLFSLSWAGTDLRTDAAAGGVPVSGNRGGPAVRPSRVRLLFLVALTLAALALRFWRLGAMPLFGDEAYYLLWADRLAPAYLDHPAGIAFLMKLSTTLLGRNELGVRWLNALLSTACVPLAYAVGRRYVSTLGGLFSRPSAVAFGPVYLITGRVATRTPSRWC